MGIIFKIISIISIFGIYLGIRKVNFKKENRYLQLYVVIFVVTLNIALSILAWFLDIRHLSSLIEKIPFIPSLINRFFNWLLLKAYHKTLFYTSTIILSAWLIIKSFINGSIFIIHKLLSKLFHIDVKIWYKNIYKAFYQCDDNQNYSVKYSHVLGGRIFLIISYICLFIIILSNFQVLPIGISLINFVINMLPITFVFFYITMAELGYFLGGDLIAVKKDRIKAESVVSKQKLNYDRLFNHYNTNHSNEILYSVNKQNKRVMKNLKVDYKKVKDAYSSAIWTENNVKSKGYRLNKDYYEIILKLYSGRKNLLVNNLNYNSFAPYLFSSFQWYIVQNKNIIIVTKDQSTMDEIFDWCKSWLSLMYDFRQDDFCVRKVTSNTQDNREPNILITCLEFLKDKQRNFDCFYKNLDLIILFETHKLLGLDVNQINTFMSNLTVRHSIKPTFLCVSEERAHMEENLETIIMDEDTLECTIPMEHASQEYIIIWKGETKEINKYNNKSICTDTELIIPAINHAIYDIQVVNQRGNPWREDKEDAIIYYELREGVWHGVSFLKDNWNLTYEDTNFVIYNDYSYHLPRAVANASHAGIKSVFANIITTPYLLRAYFIANLDVFMHHINIIPSYSSRINEMNCVSMNLVDRMLYAHITDDQLRLYLKRAKIQYASIIDGIEKLLKNIFIDIEDIKLYIITSREKEFDYNEEVFITKTKYRFHKNIIKKSKLFQTRYYKVINCINNKTIEYVYNDLIFTNYLSGQIHIFDGRAYKIIEIDEEAMEMHVSFTESTKPISYKQDRNYLININEPIHPLYENTYEYNENSLRIIQFLSNFEVRVNGYFKFNNVMNLLNNTLYKKFNESVQWKRNFGNVLLINLNNNEYEPDNMDKVSFTLMFLLNELTPTLFPEHYHNIRFCCDQTVILNQSEINKNVNTYIPSLIGTEEIYNKFKISQGIKLFVIEDRDVSQGINDCISTNLEYIFCILYDFIKWTLDNKDQKEATEYLSFGTDKILDCFDLEGTMSYLKGFIRSYKITEYREGYQEGILSGGYFPDGCCYYCGRPLDTSNYDEINNTRLRCHVCRETAVDTPKKFVKLQKKVKRLLSSIYDMKIDTGIELYFVSEEELLKQRGIDDKDIRLLGFARKQGNKYKFYIENGAPEAQTYGVMAHEFTHIWQYQELNFNSLELEEMEGMAMWVEIDLLKKIHKHEDADIVHEQTIKRDDEYGKGYLKMLDLLDRNEELSTPIAYYRNNFHK